jgi:DNA-binding response OmpR family regulator
VILDVNLPDTDGYELCKEMQSRTGVFVLMLTGRTDESDKIRGFNEGADDYLTKPFSLLELEVRVGAILKRQRPVTTPEQQCLVFNSLAIDPVRREVMLRDELVPLTALEFDLLHFLASHPGRVWRRSELIQKVWDYDYVGDQRVVDVHVGQIRKKIEKDTNEPALIQTVRGVGYKFEPPKLKDSLSPARFDLGSSGLVSPSLGPLVAVLPGLLQQLGPGTVNLLQESIPTVWQSPP